VVSSCWGLPVGFQNSATGIDLGIYAARSYSLMRPQNGLPLDRPPGEVGDGMVGPRQAELAAVVGSSSVVVAVNRSTDVRRPRITLTASCSGRAIALSHY
jgi:hypothetical protein